MPVTPLIGGLPVNEARGLIMDSYGIHWCSQPDWHRNVLRSDPSYQWDLCHNCARINPCNDTDYQQEHDLAVHCQDRPLRIVAEDAGCGCAPGTPCGAHRFELKLNGLL